MLKWLFLLVLEQLNYQKNYYQSKWYNEEQISMINPKLIVALGLVAARTLLKIDIPLKKMRGITHSYAGIPLRVTYHPAALLRNQKLKKGAWEDFQWVQNYLNTN